MLHEVAGVGDVLLRVVAADRRVRRARSARRRPRAGGRSRASRRPTSWPSSAPATARPAGIVGLARATAEAYESGRWTRSTSFDERLVAFSRMRALVTGGGGFLGSHLVERLEADGHDVVVARSADYDLTSMDDTARMFGDADAELVFHLAAEVGGIGANRANPGRYWFANLTMGANVLEQARLHETPKLVIVGTVCAYPKFAPVPFSEDDLWDGYPEETNAPYGVAKKAVLVGAQAYREQYGLDAIFLLPDEPLRAARQLRPRDVARHPGAHPEDGRGGGRGRALGRRLADARVPLRRRLRRGARARRRALRRPRARQPRRGPRDLDPRARRADRRRHRLRGPHRVGHGRSRTASRGGASTARRARELFGFEARTPLRDGIERTVAWYRSAIAGVGRR